MNNFSWLRRPNEIVLTHPIRVLKPAHIDTRDADARSLGAAFMNDHLQRGTNVGQPSLVLTMKEAYEVLHRLSVDMHYRSCSGGVGEAPRESARGDGQDH